MCQFQLFFYPDLKKLSFGENFFGNMVKALGIFTDTSCEVHILMKFLKSGWKNDETLI